ncbi:hypothetical protein DC31_08015, partial [Microbacterium sp. CH12i]
ARARGATPTIVTSRITGTWSPLPTVAHELALCLLLNEAESVKEISEIVVPEHWGSELEQVLFEDLDHEILYDERGVENVIGDIAGMTPMDIESCFVPFSSDSHAAPYAISNDD